MKKIITIAVIAMLFWGLNKVHAAPVTEATVKTINSTDVRDKNGKLVYQVKRYDESQLNRGVKEIIHSQYAAFDIVGIEEVVMPGATESLYIIHLQDEATIKVVKVYKGEAEVTGNYKRG